MSRPHLAARSIDPATREAAAWFARLRADDVTSADKVAFEDWLRSDFENRAAYERFERFWSTTGNYAGERAVTQVVKGSPSHRRIWLWSAAASLALIAVGALLAPRWHGVNGVYETNVGGRETIKLEDGSSVALNTNTRLRVAYSAERRLLQLDRGQAYFKVAKDAQRPFEVSTRNAVVRALGTEFEVYRQGTQVFVTLVEGKVIVNETKEGATSDGTGIGKILRPGELIALQPGHSTEVRPASIERSTAWLSGKLVFDDAPLEYAIAEANRYSKRKIALGNDELKDLRISGVFRAGEPDEFVYAISNYFNVHAQSRHDGDYLLVPNR